MHQFDNLFPPFSYWNTHVDHIFHDLVDDVIRWSLVDDKPEILLDTLHAANRDLYPLFTASSVLY